jgi:uncharacterized protein (DUF2235 family)
MSKRIIFCCDGTWDNKQDATNVYKLFKALPLAADQIAFYDDGVGSDGNPIDKLLGGAFGDGLFKKIKNGYTKIAHVYELGDEVFIFGFSRGAFTARSLAGMIAICGLPTGTFDNNLTDAAFQAYRNRDKAQRAALLATVNAKYAMFNAQIKMIGVWDTVGSLGIPALFGQVDPLIYGFLDTSLHSNVLNAYHALAIDERRKEFPPTLWTASSPPVAGQILEQVWFSGVHCDIGGGYPETGLADITLSWMMSKAKNLGLQFAENVCAKYAALDAKYALDQIHESWNLGWGFPNSRAIANNSIVSNSVVIRREYDNSYQPESMTSHDGAQVATYQTVQVVMEPPL